MTTTTAISSAQQSARSQPKQDQPEQVRPRPGMQAKPCRNRNEGDLDIVISIELPLKGNLSTYQEDLPHLFRIHRLDVVFFLEDIADFGRHRSQNTDPASVRFISKVLVNGDQKTYLKCCAIPEGVARICQFVASPIESSARYRFA